MKSLEYSYDRESDVLTIEGMRYYGALFRAFAEDGVALGKTIQIVNRDHGVLTIREFDRPLSALLRLWRQRPELRKEVADALDLLLEGYDA